MGKKPKPGMQNGVAPEILKQYIERIERLILDKAAVGHDIRDAFAEAKGSGFDPKTMRKIIRLRAMDREKRQEEEELLEIYMHALGMSDQGDFFDHGAEMARAAMPNNLNVVVEFPARRAKKQSDDAADDSGDGESE